MAVSSNLLPIREHSPNLGDLNGDLSHRNQGLRNPAGPLHAFHLYASYPRFYQELDDILWPSKAPTLNCLEAMTGHRVPMDVGPILDRLDSEVSPHLASLMQPFLRHQRFAGIRYIGRDSPRLHT